MPGNVEPRHVVLFVSPSADQHANLREVFRHSRWELQGSFTARNGLDMLRLSQRGVRVVFCEVRLPDTDWCGLLAEFDKLPLRPNLVVCSPLADERLWSEVLNLGAFDLLLCAPFDREEVLRVTESAWRMRAAWPPARAVSTPSGI